MLVVRPVSARPPLPKDDLTVRPATTGWYWLSLLTAGTLGTAIGDWCAEELHLGTGYATLILGGIIAIVLTTGRQSGWTSKLAFWSAIVAIRAAGTTAGDWMAFREEPGLKNGLNLGLPLSTALSCAFFVTVLCLWKANVGNRQHQTGHGN
jgi:uncharacterized membrane-anchored protein